MKLSIISWLLKALCFIGRCVANALRRTFSFVRSFCVETESAVAIAMTLASLAIGMWLVMTSGGLNVWRFFVPLKAIGVFAAGFGCFYGGLLMEKAKTNAMSIAAREAAEKASVEAGKHSAELKEAQDEARKLNGEKELLDNELVKVAGERDKALSELRERKGCGLDIGIVKDIAELNLAEVELTIDKFHGEDWEAPSDSFVMRNTGLAPDPAKRYLGVLRRSCLVKYGIDMKGLKLLATPDKIIVFGLAAKVTGTKNVSDEWMLAQVQEYGVRRVPEEEAERLPAKVKRWNTDGRCYAVDDSIKEFKGSRSLDKSDLQTKKDEWVRELTEEIDTGCNMKGIDRYVVDMAENLVRLLLRPLGKQIEFDRRPIAEAEQELVKLGFKQDLLTLEDFATSFNMKLLEQGI